jgi:hypothetical protein
MVDMPKSKPSLQGGVIVHRIELQSKEREMLESLVLTKSINNIMWPVVGAGSAVGGFWLANEIYGQGADFWAWAKGTKMGQAVEAGLTTDFVKLFTGDRTDK